jgi:tetratricopeptide (TPR) repeat protein
MALAEIDASSAGFVTGQITVFTLALAGILKCVSISRRPTTNSKCVWSLALFLGVFPLSVAVNWIASGTTASRAPVIVAGLLYMGLFAASIVLAVIGLVEYSRERQRFVQGRTQAIWALVLSGVFFIFVVGGAVAGFSRAHRLNARSANHELITFEELNFKFSSPGRPWVRADAAALNRDAKLAFIRASPQTYFMVIAEPLGNVGYTAETLAKLGYQRMESLDDNVRVLQQEPSVVGRLNGLEVQTEVHIHGLSMCYVQWFCVTNGWAYQVMTWGSSRERETVVEAARQMTEGFELLDYQRSPALKGGESLGDFVSTNFGYRVNCANSDLMNWRNQDTDCPFASFGALHRKNAVLAVSAVSLEGLKAEPEAVYRAFLGLLTPTDALSDAQTIREKDLEGIETTFDRNVASGKLYTYRVKVLHGGGFAYCVVAWMDSQSPEKSGVLEDLISRVEFTVAPPTLPDPAMLSTREKRAERMALNGIGLVYFKEERFEQSADFFKKAVELGGAQKGTAYLANLTLARIRIGSYQTALDDLDQHSGFVDSEPALAADRAFLQGQLGEFEPALTNYEKLFKAGYESEDNFKDYLGLLAKTQQSQKALDQIALYLKRQDSPGIVVAQGAALERLRRFDEAVALLKTEREKHPFDASLVYSLGDAFIVAGKPSEALSLCDEVLKTEGPSAGIWLLKGRAEFALKWYREAKESFNDVIREAPSNTEARDYLQILSGVLGEGSNAAAQDPVDPVPIPGELTNSLPGPVEGFGRDEGAYYVRDIEAVSFRPGKESKTTEYLKVQILSPTGVSAFSTFQLVFNPLNEEIYVNQLLVKSAPGELVSTGRMADYYVLDDRSSTSAGSGKVLNIPVAGLQPGYNVELTFTRRELGQANEFTFLQRTFSGTFPTQEEDLYYAGDTNLIRYASMPELDPEALPQGLLWHKTEPPVAHREPLAPTIVDYVPTVWIGDRSAHWPELVTNYMEAIRDRLELPDDQKRLAEKLAAGTTNDERKIAAIADYVQTNFTYKAIEFGRRARMPQAPADFVRNKYGDCKDHSVLAQQMLKAAGIPAYLSLVDLAGPVREDIPSLDQFDHMVVYIPSRAGNPFLDCTAKGFDLSAVSYGLAGREALILDTSRPRFEKIPPYPTNASLIILTRLVEITNQTDALVWERLEFRGVHAGWFREYFRTLPVGSRREYVANQFAGTSGELRDFQVEGIDEDHAPMIVYFKYLAHGQFQLVENEIAGNPPLNFERAFLLDQVVEKRTTPFEVSIPLIVNGSITVRIPANFRSKTAVAAQAFENPFVSCRISSATDDTGWRLDYRVYEPANRYAPEQYPAHNAAMQEAVNTLGPRLVFVRKEN